MSGKLVLGEDVGGPRHFLDGKPVNCGTGLEMQVPGDKWVPVRYEARFVIGASVQVYLYAEPWSAPQPHRGNPTGSTWCGQCERRFNPSYDLSCDEPEWGPTVVVAYDVRDMDRIPNVTLRWPVRK